MLLMKRVALLCLTFILAANLAAFVPLTHSAQASVPPAAIASHNFDYGYDSSYIGGGEVGSSQERKGVLLAYCFRSVDPCLHQ